MEQIELRMSALDALKGHVRSVFPTMAITFFFMAYFFGYSFSSLIPGALVCIGVSLFIALVVEPRVVYLALHRDGFTVKPSMQKDVVCSWDQPIVISSGKLGSHVCHTLTIDGARRKVRVPAVIFSYPAVSAFIKTNVPETHPIHALVTR